MKAICIGFGSVGKRHCTNLRALGYHVIAADPHCAAPEPDGTVSLFYRDYRLALADHADSAGVIIASPTAHHLDQLLEAAHAGLPCYVEKPLLTVADYRQLAAEHLLETLPLYARHVVGFQYLFHPAMPRVAQLARRYGELAFSGQDDLLSRYGPNVGDVMVAHPIATALRCLGAAVDVALISNGVRLAGRVTHQGGVSRYAFDMGTGPRQSWVHAGGERVALGACDSMYQDCLAAWLGWSGGGRRDERLEGLELGVEVSRILAEVRAWESVG